MITSKKLREAWLSFNKEKGHIDIGAVSLIGDGSTGVMFNVAGMQPLMPYLLGKPHPSGKTRLCNVQGCVRTVDIDEVGDECHFTFFEMLGNWSLGDYFKKEKTAWSFEFFTKVLGFDKNKICATVFAGNQHAPKDEEAVKYLEEAGVKKNNIYYLKDNWWDLPGTVNTPCGPDSEWFYPRHDKPCCDHCDVTCECGRWVEIGNDVYMQYKKLKDNRFEPLKNKNVDTGFGFERLLMYVNGLTDGYKTDLFTDVISLMEKELQINYGKGQSVTKSMRIIADHMRTSVMLIGDINGILPSNIGAGYILRRLLRRAIRHAKNINLNTDKLLDISKIFIEKIYNEAYPNMLAKEDYIVASIKQEVDKFNKTLELGNKEFEKVVAGMERKNQFMAGKEGYEPEKTISGKSAFRLYDTFGFPIELTKEMAAERGLGVDEAGFNEAFRQHQELARTVNAGAFKGGLADNSEWTTRLHTANHLLLAGLRKMFGTGVEQKGSNITSERLRFDFSFDRKLTEDEVKELENYVNNAIKQAIPVERLEMTFKEAKQQGAYGIHKAEENEKVSIYKIGDLDFQICGGPHAKNTSELVNFKLSKQEAVSAGVRRIKATINNK